MAKQSSIKTKKMSGNYRAFDGEIKVLQKQGEWLYGVEIWLLNDKVNRNGWRFTDMAGHKDLFRGTPILIAYINGGTGIGDGHNYRMEIDPKTGEESPSFTDATAERIVGALSDDPADFRTVERDGTTWIVGKGYLWKWYAKEVVEKIERDAEQGRAMSISIEALVTDAHKEGDVEVEDEYIILGTTILGDHVLPAVADARITALQAIGKRFNELKLRAASYEKKGRKMPDKTKNKGVNKQEMEYFSKQQLVELGKRFEGYTVLAAAKSEDGAICVCLMKGEATFTYTMSAIDETIAPEKFISVNAQTAFPFDGERCVSVDTCEVTSVLVTELTGAKCELETAQKELSALTQKVSEMQTAENARRVQAATAKADSVLAAFNANRTEKVDCKVLEAIKKDIADGKYTTCTDDKGVWIGEDRVAKEVKALCADAVMALDADAVRKSQSIHVWDKFSNSGKEVRDNGDIGSLLERKGIR